MNNKYLITIFTADYSRASEQQEADSAASKGCGIFEFLKKKPEDVPSSDVTKENKGEEKPSLAERIHLFDSSVRKLIDTFQKEKVCCHNKEDDVDQCETEEKKGIMEKIKEKLPAAKGQDQAKQPEHEDGKEKGSIVCIEKIKKKLTSHTKHEDDDEKKKET
ncbi:BnaAnng08450D [Brassica napus]|uniref:BnaAnng08450D protein n=1 Tax=Brassica napus TaxID=3708 RepID=A0A078IAA1_BRANA|nr:BnaAnng08450D [Brassica napus]